MSAVEQFVERVRAERAARGEEPTIESESVYRLLDAVVDANTTHRPGAMFAHYSTKQDPKTN